MPVLEISKTYQLVVPSLETLLGQTHLYELENVSWNTQHEKTITILTVSKQAKKVLTLVVYTGLTLINGFKQGDFGF